MKTLIKTTLILVIGLLLSGQFYPGTVKTYFLSPPSVFKSNNNDSITIDTLTGYTMTTNSIIKPQEKVHTSQYANFLNIPISTNGAANCTALVFVNKTQETWSIWHYPLPFKPNDIKKYFLGMLVDPYIAASLPFAFNSVTSSLKTNDDCSLYIFGGGTNKEHIQKATNKELSNIFTAVGISEIYDMTPHDQHGVGPVLNQVIVGKSKALKSEAKTPISIRYFYGIEDFNLKSESLKVTPRLIGGTKFQQSFKNTKESFDIAA